MWPTSKRSVTTQNTILLDSPPIGFALAAAANLCMGSAGDIRCIPFYQHRCGLFHVSLASKNLAAAAHSWISLHLVGEQHGQIELLSELLQSTEELVEFLYYGSAEVSSQSVEEGEAVGSTWEGGMTHLLSF